MMPPETIMPAPPPPGWRFRLGLTLLVLGWLCPLAIPLVTVLNLPLTWKAAISGVLLVGVPEVLCLLAVAVLGKDGFNYLKGKFLALFKKYALPKKVSRCRYRLGLVMFITPVILGWAMAYVSHLVPGYAEHRFAVNFTGDLVWLGSLLVLGSDFWDKVRALFIYRAKAVLPQGDKS